MPEKITKDILSKHLYELVSNMKSEDRNAITYKYLDYLKDNYNNFDEEAQKVVDRVFDVVTKWIGESIASMPEGKSKRIYRRIHAKADEKHWDIQQFINALSNPPLEKFKIPLTDRVKEIFVKRMQNVIDLLFDVSQYEQSGSANFAKYTLLYFCVDELLVAFHLAQHTYTNQAYSHLRTVFECLDKVELFIKQPDWVNIWCGNDENLIRREFTPSAVRTKLGRKKYDRLYSFFSEMGQHGTFRGIQARTAKSIEPSPKDTPQLIVWMGGCPREDHIVWTHSFLVYALDSVIITLLQAFIDRLDQEEAKEILFSSHKECMAFFLEDVLDWAKKQKLDTKEFEEFVKKQSQVLQNSK